MGKKVEILWPETFEERISKYAMAVYALSDISPMYHWCYRQEVEEEIEELKEQGIKVVKKEAGEMIQFAIYDCIHSD